MEQIITLKLNDMKYIRGVIIMISLLAVMPVRGQKDGVTDRSGLRQMAIEFGSPNWLVFKRSARFDGTGLFSEAKQAFDLSSDDEMRMVSVVTDAMGYRHYRYQQTYKGIDVEGAVYCVHEYGGRVVSANGRIVTGMNMSVIPRVQRATILNNVRMDMGNPTLSQESIKLVYTLRQDTMSCVGGNYVLAYEVSVGNTISYYDAETGNLFKSHSNVYYNDNCHDGLVNTLYNGSRTITTKKYYWKYILVDYCRGGGIETFYNGGYLRSDDNIWNHDMEQVMSATAHWAAEMTFDYYLDIHGRSSFDGNGSSITVYVKPSGNQNNAFWSYNTILCGVGDGLDTGSFVSLDVVGHEFTHGVVQSTANLGIQGEAGALNESFSDIFGTMVEFYVEGDNGDYLIAEDVIPRYGGLRNMSDPNQKNHPDTYQGDMWYTGDDELIKVHTNSGVQNYWFYLLAEGGEGMNDNGYSYDVQGIGREKAAMIAYYNMVYYMNSSCGYADARNGAILSAAELFGVNSIEVQSTIAAWDAVGVNNAGDLLYDVETECDSLQTVHEEQELPVVVAAIHGIESNCRYVANQVPVKYYAGKYVLLTDGFCSGDDFTAFTFPEIPGSQVERGEEAPAFCTGAGPDREDAVRDDSVDVQTEEAYVAIYPNPSMSYINIVPNVPITSVMLYDIFGKQVYKEVYSQNVANSAKVDIGSLAQGIYIVEVRLSDGGIVVERLMKK